MREKYKEFEPHNDETLDYVLSDLYRISRSYDSLKAKTDSQPALVDACKDALPLVERHSLSAAKLQRLKAAIAAAVKE